jgi:hypothetical protein
MTKITKTLLHLWITIVSVAAFAFGWVFLAHAQKPAPLIPTQPPVEISAPSQPLPTLQPVPSLNDYLQNSAPAAPRFQSPTFIMPRLRTGGS